jgi:hypothetical protein
MTRRGLDNLVKIAGRTGGHYITPLGAERYQVATERGRIVLKSGTYEQAMQFLEAGDGGHKND